MTTHSQKRGKTHQVAHNYVKHQNSMINKQLKNKRVKRFQDATQESYYSKRSFIAEWKPYFPKNVLENKWRKMKANSKKPKRNPFSSKLSDLWN